MVPPVKTLEQVVSYKQRIQKAAPNTTFLMTLYLTADLTPEYIRSLKGTNVVKGIKWYPSGVTTNSSQGVDPTQYEKFFPVFEAMQEVGIYLNLHGELGCTCNGTHEDVDILNAEEKFLPILKAIHTAFQKLKIVLEHTTSKAAVDIINEINLADNPTEDPNATVYVASSITAHHLFLTLDDWAGNPFNFCKPVAKRVLDRTAVVSAAVSGKPWFFFGSDSAPHPVVNKMKRDHPPAGLYTQSHALSYLAEIFENAGKLNLLKNFVSTYGQQFYGIKDEDLISKKHVVLTKKDIVVPRLIGTGDDGVVPFKAGETLKWSIEWRD